MRRLYPTLTLLVLHIGTLVIAGCGNNPVQVRGDQTAGGTLTLNIHGPQAAEDSTPNPFRFYRLSATFTHEASNTSYEVPGYFAADGQAEETSATAGRIWKAHFTPDRSGAWSYELSFRKGENVALAATADAGSPVSLDGHTGTIQVDPRPEDPDDLRSRGMLNYVGERYLQFENGTYFLKGGPGSPENLLAYEDFDGTFDADGMNGKAKKDLSGEARAAQPGENTFLHRYDPHVSDWKEGNPTWQNGKGKGLIGTINYIADQGMKSIYLLTMNVVGDGNDLWPWTAPHTYDRYDISKLAQWEIVFNHMDQHGLLLHLITQETENDTLLDSGQLGPDRKLYYRELVARFGHHRALVWNLGEENTNTDAQRKAFGEYIRSMDPYDHPLVIHTYPGWYDRVYTPLLGSSHLEGPSLQMGNPSRTHEETKQWIRQSRDAGRPWFVAVDETGPASDGVRPDGPEDNHAKLRHQALWGNLMAGGSGAEWYFGYDYPHNDLNAENWRSRQDMWNYTRYALQFFHDHLPFWQMQSADNLSPDENDYVFAREGGPYVVYLPNGGAADLRLPDGLYRISWYNPRSGGSLQTGSTRSVSGGSLTNLGTPPTDINKDWALLVEAQ